MMSSLSWMIGWIWILIAALLPAPIAGQDSPCSVTISPQEFAPAIIWNAPANSTICFAIGTHTSACNIMIVEKDLNFRGVLLNGELQSVLDCGEAAQHFLIINAQVNFGELHFINGKNDVGGCLGVVSAARVTIQNSTFSRCHATNLNYWATGGGAIAVEYMAELRAYSSNFFNNYAGSKGGAISGSDATVTIQSSVFEGNSADVGGAFSLIGRTSSATLNSSNFTNNLAAFGGALNAEQGSILTLEYSTLALNKAHDGGAIVLFEAKVQIIDSSILSNRAGNGGGLLGISSSMAFQNSEINFNSADFEGGAALATDTAVAFDSCVLNKNSAGSTGGAIHLVNGYTSAFNSTITHCDSRDGGGIVALGSFLELTSSTLDYNTAGIAGGGVLTDDSDLILSFSTVTGCTSGLSGAGIFSYESSLTLIHSTIAACTSIMEGGGITSIGGSLSIRQSTLSSNAADTVGGSVYAGYLKSEMEIIGSSINNSSVRHGGGALHLAESPRALIADSVFTNNSAYGSWITTSCDLTPGYLTGGFGCWTFWVGRGGAIRLFKTSLSSLSSNFSFNHAGSTGGAISADEESMMQISENVFDQNIVDNIGGAIDADYLLHISGSVFSSNVAIQGGAISNTGLGTNPWVAWISNSVFLRNTAASSGGAIRSYQASVDCHNCSFTQNYAEYAGGALKIESQSTFHAFPGTIFALNSAPQIGGGVASLDGGMFQSERSIITHNSAGNGGAFRLSFASWAIFSETEMTFNRAEEYGGVAYLDLDSQLFLEAGQPFYTDLTTGYVEPGSTASSNISFNWAGLDGGVFTARRGASIVVGEIPIHDNHAMRNGGVVYLSQTSWIDFNTTSLLANSAGQHGGVVYGVGATIRAAGSTVRNNTALSDAGSMFALESEVFASHVAFTDNSAKRDGGAIYAVLGSDIKLDNTELSSNSAGRDGGGVSLLLDARASVTSSLLFLNSARRSGGGIFADAESHVLMECCALRNNSAECGGGLGLQHSTSLVTDSELILNLGVSGGAICVQDASNLELRNSQLLQNSALDGGALYLLQSSGSAKDTNLSGNLGVTGGAAHLSGDLAFLSIKGGRSARNQASGAGGFVFHTDDQALRIVDFQCREALHQASYGPCFATGPKSLRITQLPESKVQPGQGFGISFRLTDQYNQTVNLANSAVVQVYEGSDTSPDTSFSFRGETLKKMTKGEVSFESLAILPKYEKEAIDIIGLNTQFQGGSSSKSVTAVATHEGQDFSAGQISVSLTEHGESCDPGHILQLNQANEGECVGCPVLTYTIARLATTCIDCPVGAKCSGLNNFDSLVPGAIWHEEFDSIGAVVKRIDTCPPGYIMIREADPRLDDCQPCPRVSYTLHPNATSCVDCPVGAQCKGLDHFESLVPGAVWEEEWDSSTSALIKRITYCPSGFILVRGSHSRLDECVECPQGKYSLVPAEAGGNLHSFQAVNATDLCEVCSDMATCHGGSHVEAKIGFWRLPNLADSRRDWSNHSDSLLAPERAWLYRCPKAACLGNNSCTEGREGKLCYVCQEGWAPAGTECRQCGEFETLKTVAIAMGVPLFLLAWYLSVWRPMFVGDEGDWFDYLYTCGCCGSLTPFFDKLRLGLLKLVASSITDYVKILVSFYQVISTFDTVYIIEWPPELRSLWELGVVLRLDVFNLPFLHCVTGSLDYLTKLQVVVLAPLVIIFLLSVPTLVLVAEGQTSKPRFRRVYNAFWYFLLLFVFLLYPFLSITTASAFSCRNVGGQWWLVSDMNRECPYTQQHIGPELLWAIFGVVLYPAGIPLFLYAALRFFKVNVLAQTKYESALITEMVLKLKKSSSHLLTHRIAEYIGSPTELQTVRHRADLMFNAASDGRELVSRDMMELHLKEIGIHGRHSKEVESLMKEYDSDGDGHLERHEFAAMIEQVMTGDGLFTMANLTVESVTEIQLEFLCRYDWNKLLHEEFGDLTGGGSAIKRTVLKQLGRRPGSAASEANSELSSFGLFRRKRSSASNLSSVTVTSTPETQDETDESMVCKLPSDAPRQDKMKWVIGIGQKLILTGAIAVAPVRWNGELEEEQEVLDKLGFFLETYKVQNFAFELVEMFRKFFMTSLIVFLWPGSIAQMASAFIVTGLSVVLYARVSPFTNPFIDNLQNISLATQAATLFYGLMIAVRDLESSDESNHHETNEDIAMRVIVFTLNLIIFILPVGTLAYAEMHTGECGNPLKGCLDKNKEELSTSKVLNPQIAVTALGIDCS